MSNPEKSPALRKRGGGGELISERGKEARYGKRSQDAQEAGREAKRRCVRQLSVPMATGPVIRRVRGGKCLPFLILRESEAASVLLFY